MAENMANNYRTYVHHSNASSNCKQMSIYSFLAINFHRHHHEIAMNSNVEIHSMVVCVGSAYSVIFQLQRLFRSTSFEKVL